MKKKEFKSIRWEIMAVVILLTLAVVGIMSFSMLTIQKKSLTNEVELRGVSITRNIANNIADFLLIKYDLEAAKILKEAMNNKGVEYAMVVGGDGKILAHNDMTHVKKTYSPIGKKIDTTPAKDTVYETSLGEKIIDFTAPAVAKGKVKIGIVHVGISYSVVENILQQTYLNIILVTLIAVVLSMIGAFLLSTAITRPINALSEGAKIVGSGDLNHKIILNKKNELGVLAATFNMMTDDLKTAHEAALEQRALEKELEIAAKIQEALLPKIFPGMAKYEVAAFYKPAKEIGGDYYDVIPLSNSKFGLVMADVSGKGIPAGLIMTMLSSILNIEAKANMDPILVITKLNDELLTRITNSIFATVFYGVLDIYQNSIEMVSAGHHEMLIYREKEGMVESICPKGVAIGFLTGKILETSLNKEKALIEAGDKLLLFTDGVSDARAGDGQRFGIERVIQSLKNNGKKGCSDILDRLLSDVENFTGGQEQSDDIAILSIGRKI
jgi:serine phosphatase RsbU (regulator of sigma subunit)